ncbi:MAG: UvrD-helicase domain-containing protein [Candidatus Tagabacteria bacterium]
MVLLKGLNKNQKEAVCHAKGPLLVVAGAGTGKTKVVTHRIAKLINRGVNPGQILAVTFTNKAAQEMTERIADLNPTPGFGDSLKPGVANLMPTVGTFHAIAADIIRKHGNHVGISPRFSISDERESLEIIKSSIEEIGLNSRQFKPSAIQNVISQKKSRFNSRENDCLVGKTEADEEFFPKNINLILEKYNKELETRGALDFDDLIQKTVLLFENYPKILKIYQEKWPYIHIDEYQDTDNSQHQLIHLLGGALNNIFAVGDEDQSIYGFRGADFTNILNFEKTWPRAKIICLERNYRSTQKILDAANAIIAENKIRRQKNLFTREKTGTQLTAFEARDEYEEADFVAKNIKRILQKETLASPIAVLCRANFQFSVFEEAFRRYSLPYQAATDQDSFLNGKQVIRLMTVHAAKGLEFKYVFIPGLEKGLFPHSNGDKEEERRLFYVALTRAQERIFISFCRYRNAFGSKQINQPSQFLSDIPKNLIKWL